MRTWITGISASGCAIRCASSCSSCSSSTHAGDVAPHVAGAVGDQRAADERGGQDDGGDRAPPADGVAQQAGEHRAEERRRSRNVYTPTIAMPRDRRRYGMTAAIGATTTANAAEREGVADGEQRRRAARACACSPRRPRSTPKLATSAADEHERRRRAAAEQLVGAAADDGQGDERRGPTSPVPRRPRSKRAEAELVLVDEVEEQRDARTGRSRGPPCRRGRSRRCGSSAAARRRRRARWAARRPARPAPRRARPASRCGPGGARGGGR